jgi:hypothetical protein
VLLLTLLLMFDNGWVPGLGGEAVMKATMLLRRINVQLGCHDPDPPVTSTLPLQLTVSLCADAKTVNWAHVRA